MMGGLLCLFTTNDDFGAVALHEASGDWYLLAEGINDFFEILRSDGE